MGGCFLKQSCCLWHNPQNFELASSKKNRSVNVHTLGPFWVHQFYNGSIQTWRFLFSFGLDLLPLAGDRHDGTRTSSKCSWTTSQMASMKLFYILYHNTCVQESWPPESKRKTKGERLELASASRHSGTNPNHLLSHQGHRSAEAPWRRNQGQMDVQGTTANRYRQGGGGRS